MLASRGGHRVRGADGGSHRERRRVHRGAGRASRQFARRPGPAIVRTGCRGFGDRRGAGARNLAFPSGRPRRAILHRLDGEIEAVSDEALDIASVDELLLHSLPTELATEVEGSYIAAFRRVEGLVVSACSAASITETLWDVGIDTLEGHRRMGHARSCYLALASHLAAQGLSPVWGAYEDNEPSLSMARSLGFISVDEIWVIELEDENRQVGAP